MATIEYEVNDSTDKVKRSHYEVHEPILKAYNMDGDGPYHHFTVPLSRVVAIYGSSK